MFLDAHAGSPIISDPHCSSAVLQLISLCITPVSFTAGLTPDVTHSVRKIGFQHCTEPSHCGRITYALPGQPPNLHSASGSHVWF